MNEAGSGERVILLKKEDKNDERDAAGGWKREGSCLQQMEKSVIRERQNKGCKCSWGAGRV
jgi:hypothetical protein